ncbi:MAG: hypothetical protein ACLFNU_02605 [Bacteroidales bacterium]
MIRILYTIILVIILSVSVQAQRASYFRRLFVDAEYYLLYEDYRDALPLYMELYEKYPNNANVAYRIGQCYLNIPNQKHRSLSFFELAIKDITDSYNEGYFTEKQAPPEAYLNYGRALRIQYDFEKALDALNKYKALISGNNSEGAALANHEIKSIEYAQESMGTPIDVKFTSVGRTVNSRFPEIMPVVTQDEEMLVYTSVQQFYSAIMMSTRRSDIWTHPINLNSQMFADGPIRTTGISADGTTLLLARNDNDIFNLYTSNYDSTNNSWSVISRMPREINSRSWENYASFSPTADTLYFSSNRSGGAGGFDIYMSAKVDGEWGEAVNMGEVFNTTFDEIAPVISHDGQKLFFSSKGHTTMGGFDVFVSYKENGKWTKPQNLGYPLNTTDNDVFFYPVGNGARGYMSRSMPDNAGEDDIYLVEFDVGEEDSKKVEP